MFYPDLTSLAQVNDLPMSEFNLRVQCVRERLGIVDAPEEGTQPITKHQKRRIIQLL